MATGSGRNSPPSNSSHAWTYDNAWMATKTTALVGAWKGKTQMAAKEETTNQYAAFHGSKGDRGARGHEGDKRAQVTPERPRRGHTKAVHGKQPHKATKVAKAKLIQVKPSAAQMIALAKTLEVLDPSG